MICLEGVPTLQPTYSAEPTVTPKPSYSMPPSPSPTWAGFFEVDFSFEAQSTACTYANDSTTPNDCCYVEGQCVHSPNYGAGSIASGTMTGTIETTMFGSVARGDLELTKM